MAKFDKLFFSYRLDAGSQMALSNPSSRWQEGVLRGDGVYPNTRRGDTLLIMTQPLPAQTDRVTSLLGRDPDGSRRDAEARNGRFRLGWSANVPL